MTANKIPEKKIVQNPSLALLYIFIIIVVSVEYKCRSAGCGQEDTTVLRVKELIIKKGKEWSIDVRLSLLTSLLDLIPPIRCCISHIIYQSAFSSSPPNSLNNFKITIFSNSYSSHCHFSTSHEKAGGKMRDLIDHSTALSALTNI